jgi:hypothetical protein
VNDSGDEALLAKLIERSAELKRALVDFACSSRFERHMARFMEAADPGVELSESGAIGILDRFALEYRLPDGKTVLDQFLASRPALTAADREMLHGWRDPVEGIFEIRGKDRDAIILLNLLDDLEYRTYSNMGPAAFRRLPEGGFVHARLVPVRPLPGVWLVSGALAGYPASSAAQIAEAALDLAAQHPELVYRNPEKLEQRPQADAQGQSRVHGVLRRRRAGPSARQSQRAAQRLLPPPPGSRARRLPRAAPSTEGSRR